MFYHLEEYEEALRLALESGDLFNLNERSQYVETLISKCVDEYTAKRVKKIDQKEEDVEIDEKMLAVIEKMFARCFADGQYNQAIGVAVEARNLEKLQEAIEKSGQIEDKLSYTFKIVQRVVMSKALRNEILHLLLRIYEKQEGGQFDHSKISQCQFYLDMPKATAILIKKLLESEEDFLIAYQIAFDTADTENQAFLNTLYESISAFNGEAEFNQRLEHVKRILKGDIRDKLTCQFLKKNNYSDMNLLKQIKGQIGEKNSITHGALVWANGIMNAHTTNDVFLRDHINWVAKATNWGRFSATASLGMIHMGNRTEAQSILAPYFGGGGPNGQSSPYSTAGAYFAYGLINANNCTQEVTDFLTGGFRNSGQNEAIQHGICLGLGTAAMATKDEAIYNELKGVLYADSAVAGEGAGIGMGLVMLGSGDQSVIEELLTHAYDSKHEKIIRSIGLALAMLMYGKEDNADTLIEQMVRSKDSIIRYGAMFAIGLAYAGTANNSAVQKLLGYAVSDVSDDVKRAALMNMGFLLFNQP